MTWKQNEIKYKKQRSRKIKQNAFRKDTKRETREKLNDLQVILIARWTIERNTLLSMKQTYDLECEGISNVYSLRHSNTLFHINTLMPPFLSLCTSLSALDMFELLSQRLILHLHTLQVYLESCKSLYMLFMIFK